MTAPRVTYSPASEGTDPLRPFVMDVMGGRVVAYMTRSQLRVLVNDCEAAAALDREARQCPDDTHDFVRADAQPLAPRDAVAVVCRNCPATGVLEPAGDVVPVTPEVGE